MELQVGINIRGRRGLVIDRPRGSGDFVLVHALEELFLDRSGSMTMPAGWCVVYRPDTPSYLASDRAIYNSFLRMPADLGEHVLGQFQVPIGRPFSPGGTPIVDCLSRIQCEWVKREHHWESALRLCVSDLFLQLSRAPLEHAASIAPPNASRLREVRLAVHRAPEQPWTVSRMAALAHLRESQFTLLYRRLFGCTPIQDLLQVRLALARYYLTYYELTVREVAHLCGFSDLSYFSRYFRRVVGTAPSTFRRAARDKDNDRR